MMEELVKMAGFDSLGEFNRLVGEVDISTPEQLKKFKDWQHDDGSKAGLISLGIVYLKSEMSDDRWEEITTSGQSGRTVYQRDHL